MIIHIVGARPNYVKAAPVIRELDAKNKKQLVINTTQHFSDSMSKDIMQSVDMKDPDVWLEPCKGTPVERLSHIMTELDNIFAERKPEIVIVYGDVDSTVAGAIVAKKHDCILAHVESGLRSHDNKMPEELNRKMVDEISDILFVTEHSALETLQEKENVCFVGNTMIDSLVHVQKKGLLCERERSHILFTCHRPSNVDNKKSLCKILDAFDNVNNKIVWPMHPRTKSRLVEFDLWQRVCENKNIEIHEPLNYTDFLKMVCKSIMVITDSGGVQEETTFLQVPCITIRENTERPSTIIFGKNKLCGLDSILTEIENVDQHEKRLVPPLWDGKASERLVNYLDHLC
tara:strand:- start:28 stop:1062 length:1035 start_codon:yes stop_codon:yes gene_type:complete